VRGRRSPQRLSCFRPFPHLGGTALLVLGGQSCPTIPDAIVHVHANWFDRTPDAQ
jgi:hypothetical protein